MDSQEGYRVLHEAAGLVDRSELGRIAVAGNDRLAYLHAMLTNDIATLVPGRGCYSAYLTPQGRMIADMRVLELGDLALLDLEAPTRNQVIEKLDQFVFSEDVQLSDLTDTLAEIGLYGPTAAPTLATWLREQADGAPAMGSSAAELGALTEFQSVRVNAQQRSVVIVRSAEIGVAGFDLFVDRAGAAALTDGLRRAGAVGVDPEAVETVRIEAGRPRFLRDMNAETIPLEAGIEQRAISFAKGCYPGQEVIIRVVHRGHGRVARRLVGFLVDGGVVPQPGDKVIVQEKEAGWITSSTFSPARGGPIALGYAQRDQATPGTAVTIVRADARIAATVSTLPFIGAASQRSLESQ
jgi:folate-binding protein YgfZ